MRSNAALNGKIKIMALDSWSTALLTAYKDASVLVGRYPSLGWEVPNS